MKLFRTLTIAAGVALALATTADLAQAGPPCHGCGHGFGSGFGGGFGGSQPRTLFGSHKSNQPAFQAAPWYLYWPYDAHFQTPAPVTGAFYGPPLTGNFPVNPYFPSSAYGFGFNGVPSGAPGLPIPQPMTAAPGR